MKSAALAVEELNEQVSHRLMELDHESRVKSAACNGMGFRRANQAVSRTG